MLAYLLLVVFHGSVMRAVPKLLHSLPLVEVVHMLLCSLLSMYVLLALAMGMYRVR